MHLHPNLAVELLGLEDVRFSVLTKGDLVLDLSLESVVFEALSAHEVGHSLLLGDLASHGA